ncbi:MAG TPA: SDR family NAD(P)-dependent oxidoreductase [Solirubrobacteraceae bacterium]|jgi:3-oxoacyl-[acyl-carrier protein] reductase|nr:SDR family NAD(P)-dependent oxidoreductase [Solirubrobacteraceae bacterium]
MSEGPTYPDLRGKTAFVTGGSKGIGRCAAQMLAANGVNVAVVARGAAEVDTTVDELREAGAEAIGVTADCTSAEQLEDARRVTEDKLGPVNILMAFAGGFGARTPVQDITEAEWHHVIESNLTSTFLTVKTFLPGMIERRAGSIVTMSSNAGRLLDITLTASYAAAKAGIAMFTRHLAKEVGEYGIRANIIAPATLATDRVKGVMDEEMLGRIGAMAPLGRIGRPEDAALVALFLASESAGWLTGITIDVAGGRIML